MYPQSDIYILCQLYVCLVNVCYLKPMEDLSHRTLSGFPVPDADAAFATEEHLHGNETQIR